MSFQKIVLFVDDEEAIRETTAELLADAGYSVLTAADGYEAIRVLIARHVDLLFTDLVMPGLDGLDLAAQAKLIRPALRLLYATGNVQRAAAKSVGEHVTILEKPIRSKPLIEAVKHSLGSD
jgi:two-component system, NtrC family, sensor kinase